LKKLNQSNFLRKYVGSTALKPKKVYTGKNMIGIAQIPKSNAVPVFSTQQAKDTVKVK
jgi:hypothetical protein